MLYHSPKLTKKWSTDLNRKGETVKFVEDYIENLADLELTVSFQVLKTKE